MLDFLTLLSAIFIFNLKKKIKLKKILICFIFMSNHTFPSYSLPSLKQLLFIASKWMKTSKIKSQPTFATENYSKLNVNWHIKTKHFLKMQTKKMYKLKKKIKYLHLNITAFLRYMQSSSTISHT